MLINALDDESDDKHNNSNKRRRRTTNLSMHHYFHPNFYFFFGIIQFLMIFFSSRKMRKINKHLLSRFLQWCHRTHRKLQPPQQQCGLPCFSLLPCPLPGLFPVPCKEPFFHNVMWKGVYNEPIHTVVIRWSNKSRPLDHVWTNVGHCLVRVSTNPSCPSPSIH